ncbi:hypothetical protein HELRODRAFT_151965, partial [Helobdella robusta]|uniref:NADAR domain-containing protein n=1 Tax=Helobdella robusta TaxID=6412 RepID=T1EKN4_HELRO
QEKFTYFWRYESPFSQHYPVTFELDGMTFNCAEQYYMFKKADTFGDQRSIFNIMKSCSPIAQKSLGRKVAGFDRNKWDAISRQIVRKANFAKFSQNEELLQILLSTRGTTLVEASPKDALWGINLEADNYLVLKRNWWRGQNWLGEELTKLRD